MSRRIRKRRIRSQPAAPAQRRVIGKRVVVDIVEAAVANHRFPAVAFGAIEIDSCSFWRGRMLKRRSPPFQSPLKTMVCVSVTSRRPSASRWAATSTLSQCSARCASAPAGRATMQSATAHAAMNRGGIGTAVESNRGARWPAARVTVRAAAGHESKCRLANSRPDPDFRYRSKRIALPSSGNTTTT